MATIQASGDNKLNGRSCRDRTRLPKDWMRFGAPCPAPCGVVVCAEGERMETTMSEMEFVSAVQAALAERVGRERYECWFAHNTRLEFVEGRLKVCVASAFYQNWLQGHFRAPLESACRDVLGHAVEVAFVIDAAATPSDLPRAVAAPPGMQQIDRTAAHALRTCAGEWVVSPLSSHSGIDGASEPSMGAGSVEAAAVRAAAAVAERIQGDRTAPPKTAPGSAPPDGRQQSRTGGPGEAAAHKANSAAAQATSCGGSPGRRRLASLQQFVAGPENAVAHAAALSAVECPGRSSPLVFYGPTSVGKTHLLEGVLAASREQRPAIKAVYLTAEQFTMSFLDALHGSGLPNFRRKLRDLDLFLLDDLQFLTGKKATLVEFIHTLDTLHRGGKQVVLSSDRPPAELRALGQELVTRLQAGLCLAVNLPGEATRLHLVRNLAARLGIEADDSVLQHVAQCVPSHARALLGALRRLEITARAEGCRITLELAERALADVIPQHSRAVCLSDIERAVCDVCGVTQAELHSESRARCVADPRALAMWLARKYTRAALVEIGNYFGRKSHTSVLGAKDKVEAWLAGQAQMATRSGHCSVAEAIRQVEQRLMAG